MMDAIMLELRREIVGASSRIVLFMALLHAVALGLLGYGLGKLLLSPESYIWVSVGAMFIASAILILLLIAANDANFTKKIKLISDLIWNIWSFSAVSMLLLSAPTGSIKIEMLMNRLGIPEILAIVFTIVPAAAGKVAVSAAELLISMRDEVPEVPRRPDVPAAN